MTRYDIHVDEALVSKWSDIAQEHKEGNWYWWEDVEAMAARIKRLESALLYYIAANREIAKYDAEAEAILAGDQ